MRVWLQKPSWSACNVIEAIFLVCAMSLPSSFHTWPGIVSYHAANSEEKDIRDFIKRHHPDAEIFIHPVPDDKRLKDHGWERVPFNWKGNEVWIQRKPKPDQKKMRAIEVSA